VRNIDESRLERFRGETEVGNVELRHPSLEEIFVGYMRGDPPVPEGGPMPL
jgi:hypothetical protein